MAEAPLVTPAIRLLKFPGVVIGQGDENWGEGPETLNLPGLTYDRRLDRRQRADVEVKITGL